jgi:hypothetical protein
VLPKSPLVLDLSSDPLIGWLHIECHVESHQESQDCNTKPPVFIHEYRVDVELEGVQACEEDHNDQLINNFHVEFTPLYVGLCVHEIAYIEQAEGCGLRDELNLPVPAVVGKGSTFKDKNERH